MFNLNISSLPVQVFNDFVRIDSMLSMAMCIDSGDNIVWKKRNSDHIVYNNPIFDADLLFRADLDRDLTSNIKIEEDYEEK